MRKYRGFCVISRNRHVWKIIGKGSGKVVGERVIVNTGTGEIVGRIGEGDRIVKAKTIEFLNETQVWRIEKFYKGSVGEIQKLLPELSSIEREFLFCASVYVGYEDCCLRYENGNVLDAGKMSEIMRVSKSTIYRVLNSLRKKDIIFKGKNSEGDMYFMNPWICCRGNRINSVLKAMFKNYRIRVINKRWGDI